LVNCIQQLGAGSDSPPAVLQWGKTRSNNSPRAVKTVDPV